MTTKRVDMIAAIVQQLEKLRHRGHAVTCAIIPCGCGYEAERRSYQARILELRTGRKTKP